MKPGALPFLVIMLAVSLLTGAAFAAGDDGAHRLSVTAIPAGSPSAPMQVAVKWDGPLPAVLESGQTDHDGRFIPHGPSVTLTAAMSLLTHPAAESSQHSRWRVSDTQGATLAHDHRGSVEPGWLSQFFGPGLDGAIHAALVHEGDLIVGGDFETFDDQLVNHLVRWDGQHWSAFAGNDGIGLNGPVHALAVFGGDLIVGGSFSSAGASSANNIARWDGSEWHALGAGVGGGTSIVRALVVQGAQLIVGGWFSSPGSNIAVWSGTGWSGLGGGLNGEVHALIVHDFNFNQELIVAGSFTGPAAGPQTFNRIVRRVHGGWQTMDGPNGSGMNGTVNALAVHDGMLVAGGTFTTAGGVSANRIARWDGDWQSMSVGFMDGEVTSLTSFNGELIAGGTFSTGGAHGAARWAGEVWWPLSGPWGDWGEVQRVSALVAHDDRLFAGVSFIETVNGTQQDNVTHFPASWDGVNWETGLQVATGIKGFVEALTVFGDDLVVGGSFPLAGELVANGIACWNGSFWTALGSGFSTNHVRALALYNGALIAGGDFISAGGNTVNNIAQWTGADCQDPAGQWVALEGSMATGVSGSVEALTVFDGELIAAGNFETAGGVTVRNVARWNGLDWQALAGTMGVGVNARARALTVHDGKLFVGGDFSQADSDGGGVGLSAHRIAGWDGSGWFALGPASAPGLGPIQSASHVHALTSYQDELIAGGRFSTAGEETVNFIARWNGSNWHPLEGASGFGVWGLANERRVTSLAVHDNQLIVGGQFTEAGGLPITRIARWDGADWSAIGSAKGEGVGGLPFGFLDSSGISVLAIETYKDELFAGGLFSHSGGVSNWGLARYGTGDAPSFTVGGTVSMLIGSGLILQNNGGDDLAIATDGVFNFPTLLADGDAYEVTVLSQPADPNQTCLVNNSSGVIGAADITDIAVVCSAVEYTVTTLVSSGTITSPENPLVAHGETTMVHGQAWPDHYLLSVTGCGGAPLLNGDTGVTSFVYETGPIVGDCTVEAEFALITPLTLSIVPSTILNGDSTDVAVSGGLGTGAISVQVDSGAEFCALEDFTLTALAVGDCSIKASKAADAQHAAQEVNMLVRVVPEAGINIVVELEEQTSLGRLAARGECETLAYQIRVSNNGPMAANEVRVRLPTPDGLLAPMVWSCSGTGGSCSPAEGEGPVDVQFALAIGDRTNISFSACADPNAAFADFRIQTSIPDGTPLLFPEEASLNLSAPINGDGLFRTRFQ
ncbi:MAG: hypothetical protein JJU31_13625 [Wenzhouxiangella sp.]|nr:hypothetical protein [Wenzhouxiangella sp.]